LRDYGKKEGGDGWGGRGGGVLMVVVVELLRNSIFIKI